MLKEIGLKILRLYDKFILASKKEKMNNYKLFNKLFNKEVIYNSTEYEAYKR